MTDVPLHLLEDFAEDGHLRDCTIRDAQFPEDLFDCGCPVKLLAIAKATRQAFERAPTELRLTFPPLWIEGEWPGQEDPLILVRQLRAALGGMVTPSAFGREPTSGLQVFGRVLDQVQDYVLEWGLFALDHPGKTPPPR